LFTSDHATRTQINKSPSLLLIPATRQQSCVLAETMEMILRARHSNCWLDNAVQESAGQRTTLLLGECDVSTRYT